MPNDAPKDPPDDYHAYLVYLECLVEELHSHAAKKKGLSPADLTERLSVAPDGFVVLVLVPS